MPFAQQPVIQLRDDAPEPSASERSAGHCRNSHRAWRGAESGHDHGADRRQWRRHLHRPHPLRRAGQLHPSVRRSQPARCGGETRSCFPPDRPRCWWSSLAPSASAQSGIAFPQQPVVRIEDGTGNPVSQAGTAVTASIASGGGTLGGTTSVNTSASGVATFTNLAISGTAGPRTLDFSATGLTKASANVDLTAGAAATLAIQAGDNQTATAGSQVAVDPAVLVTDAGGNPVAGVAVDLRGGDGRWIDRSAPTPSLTRAESPWWVAGLWEPSAGPQHADGDVGRIVRFARDLPRHRHGGQRRQACDRRHSPRAALRAEPNSRNNPRSSCRIRMAITLTTNGVPISASVERGNAQRQHHGRSPWTVWRRSATSRSRGPVGNYTLTFGAAESSPASLRTALR